MVLGVTHGRPASDARVRGTAPGLRVVGVVTGSVAAQVARAQGAFPVAAAAMGRLVSAAALLGSDLKDHGHVRVTAAGGGPLGRVVAEAYADGLLRARVDHGQVDLPPTPAGKLAVGDAVGREGTLTVERFSQDGHVYTSQSRLVSGELGEDLAQYLLMSEQVHSAVALGVLVNPDGSVAASGGILIQALPDAEEQLVEAVSARWTGLADLSWRLAAGERMTDLLAGVVGAPIHWADPEPLAFGCLCSREHSRRLLQLAPPDERQQWAATGGAEVVCHYCRTAYRFGPEDLA
jgi:molecular chaperone Hsp33